MTGRSSSASAIACALALHAAIATVLDRCEPRPRPRARSSDATAAASSAMELELVPFDETVDALDASPKSPTRERPRPVERLTPSELGMRVPASGPDAVSVGDSGSGSLSGSLPGSGSVSYPSEHRSALDLPPTPRLGWNHGPPPILPPAGAHGLTVDEDVFVAHVAPDGSVNFRDRPSVEVALPIVDFLRSPKERIAAWLEDPAAVGNLPLPIVDVRFDLTDAVMRASGQDPYAARKLAFLDRTREARWAMKARATTESLRASIARTPALLERVWRGPGTAAERRSLLFALWDECAESGSEERVATADAVRAAIVAFVRRRLPTGSVGGYTTAELEAFNRRRTSRRRFDP